MFSIEIPVDSESKPLCCRPAAQHRVNSLAMRVLGIDCGTECTGYGIVELNPQEKLECVCFGGISVPPRNSMPRRLAVIFDRLSGLIQQHHPDRVAIEDVFYALNVKSALKLGQVRGVAMLAASCCDIEVTEYAPLTIKSAVVGYGRAEKEQVQLMVSRLLGLEQPPQPADAADALAIAICDLHTCATVARQNAPVKPSAKLRTPVQA
jgi:crossover junction endodeoxyribonuclease RuvC